MISYPLNSSISIVLFEPRIPQNTGNIGRTSIAFGYKLELIEPLGFTIDNKQLRRAGLDYWKEINLQIHTSFSHFKQHNNNSRIIAFSKQGGISLSQFTFRPNDSLLFGREDNGLPESIKEEVSQICTIDMPYLKAEESTVGVRSLNLSVACGIAAYYAHCSLNSPKNHCFN